MSKPRVSLCMIVKDEEDHLARCLATAAPLVDEMVVYDTGSTDRTVAIAREAGARVIEGHWDDDFGRARNAALAECSGEWILHLDADETADFDRAALRRGLDRAAGVDVLLLEIRNVGARGGDYAHVNRRLFRRRAAHWVGRLHERVEARDGRTLREANLLGCGITHYGYADDIVAARDKSARNIRIAEAELAAAGPDDDRAALLVNVGRSHGSAGDPTAALAHFRLARDAGRDESRENGRAESLRVALRLGAELLTDQRDFDEARAWIAELADLDADPRVIAFLEGSVDLLEGRPADKLASLADLDTLVADDGMGIPDRQLRLRTAMALAATQRFEQAVPALLALVEEDPSLNLWGVLATSIQRSGGDFDEAIGRIPDASLRTVLAQVLVEPVETGEAFGWAAAARHDGDPRIVGFAVHHTARIDDLEQLVPWATLIRNGHLPEQCPIIARAEDPTVPVPERFMAAVVAHAAFRDPEALPLLHRLSDRLAPEDEPAAIHVLTELAPELIAP